MTFVVARMTLPFRNAFTVAVHLTLRAIAAFSLWHQALLGVADAFVLVDVLASLTAAANLIDLSNGTFDRVLASAFHPVDAHPIP